MDVICKKCDKENIHTQVDKVTKAVKRLTLSKENVEVKSVKKGKKSNVVQMKMAAKM
jgi:hypothetical protein